MGVGPWPQVGEREADAGEKGEPVAGRPRSAGGPAKAGKHPDAGTLLSLALFLPASLTKNEPQSFF